MLRKCMTLATIVVAPLTMVLAQDSTKAEEPAKTTTITGSVDAYYRYNFSNAKSADVYNSPTSFTTSQNSFELGMASVKVAHSFGKVGAVIDLGFGPRAKEFSYPDDGITQAIKQAYVTYAPSDKVTFTFGKFGTHVGYEVLDPQVNRNYSMGYMFSYGPFSHTGLKMDVALSGTTGFMIGIANPNDLVSAPFAKKFAIAQFHTGTSNGNFTAYLNYVGGKDLSDVTSHQLDLVANIKAAEKFSIGYNGSVKFAKPDGGSSDSWWGSALYLNVDPTEKFGLTLRGEVFNDKKEVAGFGTNLYQATLSLNIKPAEGLIIIPELRMDGAKDEYFVKHDGSGTKSTGTFILAAIYSF